MKDSKRLLVVLISLVVIVSVLLVVGILVLASMPGPAPVSAPAPTAARVAAATLTPTPTFSPTPTCSPTPKPTPSPTSELEYQTEKEKLGIYEGDRIIPANYVYSILYKTQAGEYKIAFVLVGFGSFSDIISDLFTAENLFSIESTTFKQVIEEGYTESVVPINNSLMDAAFLYLSAPISIISDFKVLNCFDDDWAYALYKRFESDEDFYGFLTKSELADIYLQYIPKEYRVYGSDFTPGTKAKFPDITPSPDPSSSSNPTQTVSP
jgi:hypothetical protein